MRIHALVLAAVALAATAVPAHASDVTVSLAVSAGRYAPTGAACALSVPAGATGVDVLDAAVAQHCVTSYDTVTYPGFGTFLTCLDEVCGNGGTGTVGTYWNMYENGASTAYGVDGFSAADGDELGFAYQAFCFEVVCPPVG
jgi:hypothetical protein